MGSLFTTASGPHQHRNSQIRVPRNSWPYFFVSASRLLQPGGPGLRVYIPQEQGGPVITPGTGIPFRRLLRLAGLQWKYSTSPSLGSFLLEDTTSNLQQQQQQQQQQLQQQQ
jgi:hypothetical protein